MRFLVDENLSKDKKFLDDHKNLENVTDKIGVGASDKDIIEYAENNDCGICTQDKGCTLLGLVAGVTVWYRDQETKESVKLKARKLRLTKEESEIDHSWPIK